MKLVILLAFGINLMAFSQFSVEDINFDLIPYKKVKEYLTAHSETRAYNLNEIHASWKKTNSTDDFYTQKKIYLIKDNINNVWNQYRTTSPAESWNGKKVMFGFMYSKKAEKPLYAGDKFTEIDTGQVIFLNLKLLKFYNLAMAFEIISIDTDNRKIEFSYIDGNVSQGKQTLQFVEQENGYTEIVHCSYFKSDSKFRDKLLYPFFHTRTTNEFHRIMRKLLKQQQKELLASN